MLYRTNVVPHTFSHLSVLAEVAAASIMALMRGWAFLVRGIDMDLF